MYEIRLTNGRRIENLSSLRRAKDWCSSEWPDGEIGHDGDLDDGGERTLVWAYAPDAADDDGTRAVASIVPAVQRDVLLALRDEATAAGDADMVEVCSMALGGDRVALARVARSLDSAAAQGASVSP